MVERFVAGEDVEGAVAVLGTLHQQGLLTTVDALGEDVDDVSDAQRTRDEYLSLLAAMRAAGESEGSEVSVKLSALGLRLPGGADIAYALTEHICAASEAAGCTVTLDMEDHGTVDDTLAIGSALRERFPSVGNVLQANLRRTQTDLPRLAHSGVRIRLVKGAYREPGEVAIARKRYVDEAYQWGVRTLMASECYPMIATHDEGMLRSAVATAKALGRRPDAWEVQMLYGVAGSLQKRVVASGNRLRIYVPYGTDWYGYFTRRLAERPANVAFFLRALRKS